jgi:adenosylcobinamide kinase/adenosylcobinamide-phosphate guanylyltransferase
MHTTEVGKMENNQGKLTLMLGGARSGKSRLAEEMALAAGGVTAYIATATVRDDEMAHRVDIHKQRRPSHWITIEEEKDLAGALASVPEDTRTVIVDCLTLWLTNLLLADYNETATATELDALEEHIHAQLAKFCLAAQKKSCEIIVVSNEVGFGIVPESAMGRFFRDLAGRANQQVARAADEVYLAVAGYTVRVKGEE